MTAVICQYTTHRNPVKPAPVPRIVLNAGAADGLAAIIDDLPLRNPVELPGCGGGGQGPYAQLVRFGYSAAPAESAWITYPACYQVLKVVAGGRWLVPGPLLGDVLASYVAGTDGNDGPRVPDLIGLRLAAAEAAARRSGMTVSLTGTATDTRVPFGTVIFQALPPGFRSRLHNGPVVSVLVATRPAPSCTADQLRLTYRAVIATRGSYYGMIAIRDISREPCALTGTVQITGTNGAGQAVIGSVGSLLPAAVTLSPTSGLPPEVAPPPEVIPAPPPALDGAIWLAERYQSCRPRWVTPSDWHVTLPGGLRFTVANADPTGPVRLVRSGGLVTCGGLEYDPTLVYFGQPLS